MFRLNVLDPTKSINSHMLSVRPEWRKTPCIHGDFSNAAGVFLNHNFAHHLVIQGAGPAIAGHGRPSCRRHNRSSATASRSATNSRTLIKNTACTGCFRACGKRAAQRLHRGLRARRYATNSVLHRPFTPVQWWSGFEHCCSRRSFHTNGQSCALRSSRARDRWLHHLCWNYGPKSRAERKKAPGTFKKTMICRQSSSATSWRQWAIAIGLPTAATSTTRDVKQHYKNEGTGEGGLISTQ
jgi:hypothetical protein